MDQLLDEMVRYVGFTGDDQAALRRLLPRVEPAMIEIIDVFYERLLAHDRAREVLKDEAQIVRLKSTLRDWLHSLLSGPWDREYFERRARIGRVHVKVGLPQRYMFGGMQVIGAQLARRVDAFYDGDERQRRRAHDALRKILHIDLAIMLETYREDYLTLVERAARVDRRALERKLARAEQLASLGTLAAGLAHEIRNPLNAAKLQLLLVERRMARPDSVARASAASSAKVVRIELERLEALVQDFLAFARPAEVNPTRGDLRATVQAVCDLLAPVAEATEVALELRAGGPMFAHYDTERIKQVVINLTRNAIEAAGSGGTVEIAVISAEDVAIIEVFDTGPGVPTTVDVFAPFATSKDAGTGLGLSIVHRIVTDHGGEIDFERRGDRTVFMVRLPVGAATPEASPAPP